MRSEREGRGVKGKGGRIGEGGRGRGGGKEVEERGIIKLVPSFLPDSRQ